MANKDDFIASGPTKPDVPKSHFDLSYTNNLTANFGKIYPLGSWLMPAGSNFECNADYGFDLQPLVFPVQTNMRFHVKFYKAPLRILWKNWKNFVSRGGKGYELPYINRDTNFYDTGSLSDYMGVPSFQSTEHEYNFLSHFSAVNPFYADHLNVGDYFTYQFNFPGFSSAPTNLNCVVVSPFDGSKYSIISSDSIDIIVRSNGSPVLNSSTYLYLLIPTSEFSEPTDNAKDFSVLRSVLLTSSNASIESLGSYTYKLSISSDIFGDSTDFKLLTPLYLGFSFNVASNFGTFSEYIHSYSVAEHDINSLTDQGVTKQVVSSHTITPIGPTAFPRKPLSLKFSYSVYTSESRATHFQSVNGEKPKLPLLAFRWRMYEFIYNYFVRNERVTPFMLPDDNNVMQEVFNQYLTNDGDGADSTTPVDFKYAPYEYDLFTTCVKKPTFGDAPLVGVSFTYDMSGYAPSGEFTLLKEGDETPSNYGVSLSGDGKLTGITYYNGDANNPNLHNLQQIIDFGISVSDLRNVSAYQRYLERMVKAGTKYENIMYEFFGTNPPVGEEFPSYLGGYTDLIRTDKVLNQSASNPDIKLGEYGGNAYLRSNGGRKIQTYCQEDCYIMAVGWFSVTPTYSQKLDKDFVFTSLLDFVNPQFAAVSPQPVYDYQIAPLEIDPDDEEALTHVFGYNRPFAEAVSRQDECHGLFRSNMNNFIMQRIFAGAPQLNEHFLYMRPEDLSQIFAVTDTTDKIFGQIHFDVNATLPLPHMAIPRIV